MKYLTETRFSSMEEWNDHPHGWEVDFRPIGPGEAHSQLQQSGVPNRLIIAAGTFEAPTLQRGTTPHGMRTFALPLSRGRHITWRSHRAMRGSLLVFPDDRELHCTTTEPVTILTLSVADELVAKYCIDRDLDRSPLGGGALALVDHELNGLLDHIATFSEFIVKYGSHRHAPRISRLLEEELLQGLCERLAALSTEAERIPVDKRYRVIRAALDFIDSRIRSPIRVSEVSSAVGVSTRTLELCFRQHVGATPKQFICTQQLHGIRQDLQKADPSHELVKDIAYAWGFWHLGQFSHVYRRLFGETPGSTLQHQSKRGD